jgi:hypothetical protein
MNRSLITITIFSLLFFSFSITRQPRVSLKDGELSINKKCLSQTWLLSEFRNCLGDAEKQMDGFNKTHTYNNDGIMLYEKKNDTIPSGNIVEVQIYFDPKVDISERTPTKAYKYSLKIDQLKVNKNLSAKEMLNQLSGWTETASFSIHNYRMQKNNIYVYFLFNENETALQKISLGHSRQ